MKRGAWSLLLLIVSAALGAPWLSPNPPNRRFDDLLYAPPTRIHVVENGVHPPFIHPWRVVSRLERRFEADASSRVTLRWLASGTLVTADPDAGAPLLLLGADGYGRDIFARLLYGARATLAVAVASALLATVLGACVGGVAGYLGGWFDGVLSRVSEFVLVLPAMYVALALRAVLPLVLPPATVFALLTAIFTLLGLADCGAWRARHRARRTRTRVRPGRPRRRGQRRTRAAAASASCGRRLPQDTGVAARARVHAR